MNDAAQWLQGQLRSLLDERRDTHDLMCRLGTDGRTLAAYREATEGLKKIAARWNVTT